MQIVILGMHRSGTSAVTRLVNMMGAYFGPEGVGFPIRKDNPKGYWERRDVVETNDKLIGYVRASQHFTIPWKSVADFSVFPLERMPAELTRPVQDVIMHMDAHRPWVLKDPRLCLTLPYWLPRLELPVAVIVYRNPVEIALSLYKRDKLPLEQGLALWEYYAVGLLNASADIPRVFIDHGDLMRKPLDTCLRLYSQLVSHSVRRLDMPLEREVRAFIDPALYRAKPTGALAVSLSPEQQALVERLKGEVVAQGVVHVSERSREAVRLAL